MTTTMRPSIESVWPRINQHEGEVFTQIRGGTFTYRIEHGQLRLDRTDQLIPRSHFERAIDRVPLQNTRAVQDLRGPSYIYAILMDPRIRGEQW